MVISGPDNRILGILDERSRLEAEEGPPRVGDGEAYRGEPADAAQAVLRALDDSGVDSQWWPVRERMEARRRSASSPNAKWQGSLRRNSYVGVNYGAF